MISLRSSGCRMVMCSSGICCFPVWISVFGHMELLVHIICIWSTMITAVANADATVSTWIANGGTTGDCGMRMDTSGLATYATMVVVVMVVMMMVMMMTHLLLSTSTRTRHAVPALRTLATSGTVIAITL